jgi:leucyl aminopeptidase
VDRRMSPHKDFGLHVETALLGALQEAYIPYQARLAGSAAAQSKEILEIGVAINELGPDSAAQLSSVVEFVRAIEAGKILARDMGGSDPEVMAPLNCANHICREFKEDANIKITVEKDPGHLLKEYPLLHAVARCSLSGMFISYRK